MSLALHAHHLQTLNSAPSLPLLARWSVAFAVTATKWDARNRSRKHLKRLGPQHLRDIGIDPITAQSEAKKSFWQD